MKLNLKSLIITFISLSSACWAHTDTHSHSNHNQLLEVPTIAKIPSIAIHSTKDKVGGYNIKLKVNHYSLEAPSNNSIVGLKNMVYGHAHLYINDKKIMRLYSNSFHIPDSALQLNTNKLEVTLNNHNHQTWSANGKPIKDIIFIKK